MITKFLWPCWPNRSLHAIIGKLSDMQFKLGSLITNSWFSFALLVLPLKTQIRPIISFAINKVSECPLLSCDLPSPVQSPIVWFVKLDYALMTLQCCSHPPGNHSSRCYPSTYCFSWWGWRRLKKNKSIKMTKNFSTAQPPYKVSYGLYVRTFQKVHGTKKKKMQCI